MITIGLVANVFNEIHALPGWLETHLSYFDDVRVMHAGPGGAYSNDGTLELLEKWRIPVEFCDIGEGFGVVRSKTLRMSKCDYICLLDADERFYHTHHVMRCEGESNSHEERDEILRSYDFRDLEKMASNWENISKLGANLKVHHVEPFDQGLRLRDLLQQWQEFANWPVDAIASIRRHWHDFSFKRPTQNWSIEPDWQLRIVRNTPNIHFDPSIKMHEGLLGAEHVYHADHVRGPFFDHFHFTFKRMEPEQRAHDVSIFDAIHQGIEPPMRNVK